MFEVIGKLAVLGGAWVALIWCASCALRPLVRELDRQALDAQDGFTPSMARWGYVGENRGQK